MFISIKNFLNFLEQEKYKNNNYTWVHVVWHITDFIAWFRHDNIHQADPMIILFNPFI